MQTPAPTFRKIDDYRIVTAVTAEELGHKVREHVLKGWEQFGPAAYMQSDGIGHPRTFVQPMVVYSDKCSLIFPDLKQAK
jgi:hypothetical protein